MMCNLYPYKIITLKIALDKLLTILQIWSGVCGRVPIIVGTDCRYNSY